MTPAELDALIEHLINAERRLTVAFAKGGVVSSVLDNMRLLSNAAIALRKQGDALVQLREENARLLHSKQYAYLAHVGEVNKSGSYIWCDLVKLRDSEALARGKIAEQMIEIERLKANQRCSAIEQGDVGYPCVFRAEAEARIAAIIDGAMRLLR
jgi:hypothetical protein